MKQNPDSIQSLNEIKHSHDEFRTSHWSSGGPFEYLKRVQKLNWYVEIQRKNGCKHLIVEKLLNFILKCENVISTFNKISKIRCQILQGRHMSVVASYITGRSTVCARAYSRYNKMALLAICGTGEFPSQRASSWRAFPFRDVIIKHGA